ncbi:MAG: serine hydrolase, partial [Hyphomonadaceae bacterium]
DGNTYGADTRTSALLIVRHGQVVAERYARGIQAETPQRTWSVAKSITATILGAADEQGHVDLDYPAIIERWSAGGDPRRQITLRNLLQMASGLDSGEKGSRTDRIYFGGGRVIDQAAGRVLEAVPGMRWKYANNDTLLAMRGLREAMDDDTAFHAFPYDAVLWKIGARHTTLEIDWNGDFLTSSQVWTTARDLARIGQLYLQDGMWGNERILPEDWVEFVSTPAPAQPSGGDLSYGAQFWLLNNSPGLPEDTFAALGHRGQYLIIIPSKDVVIVRRGYDVSGGNRFDIARFASDIVAAMDATDREAEAADLALEADAQTEVDAEAAAFARRCPTGATNRPGCRLDRN